MTDYTVTMSPTQECPSAATVRWTADQGHEFGPVCVGRWFAHLIAAMEWVEERKAAERGLDVGVA